MSATRFFIKTETLIKPVFETRSEDNQELYIMHFVFSGAKLPVSYAPCRPLHRPFSTSPRVAATPSAPASSHARAGPFLLGTSSPSSVPLPGRVPLCPTSARTRQTTQSRATCCPMKTCRFKLPPTLPSASHTARPYRPSRDHAALQRNSETPTPPHPTPAGASSQSHQSGKAWSARA